MALELGKCRLCLKLGDFYSIFTVDNGVPLAEMVMECSRVKIYEGDGLPDKVCSECIQKLSGAYIFKQQCERADQDLRRNYVPPPGFCPLSPNRQSSDSAFSTHTDYSNLNKSTEGKVTPASSARKRRTESDDTSITSRHDYRSDSKHADIKRQVKKPKYLNNSMDSDDDNNDSFTADIDEPNEAKNEFKCSKCPKSFKSLCAVNSHQRVHRNDRSLENIVTPTSTPLGRSIESDNASTSSKQDYSGSNKRVTELRRLGSAAKRNMNASSMDTDDDDNEDSSFRSETAATDSDESAVKTVFKCQQCPNEYATLRSLTMHMRLHKRQNLKEEASEESATAEAQEEDDLSCNKCGKTYKLKIMLKRHQQNCNETPAVELAPQKELLVCLEPVDGKHKVKVECEICTAKFKTVDNLNKHLRVVHAAAPKRVSARLVGNVSVPCIYCQESFDDYYVHSAHFNTCPKRDERNTFKCPLCLVISFKKMAYFGHIKNSHFEPETREQADLKEDELKCSFCNKRLANQQQLITHLAAHVSNIDEAGVNEDTRTPTDSPGLSYCKYCQKEFKYKGAMLTHQNFCVTQTKGKNEVKLEVQKTLEGSSQHCVEEESSQDDFDNTCDICDKQFSYKGQLLHHKKTKHYTTGNKTAGVANLSANVSTLDETLLNDDSRTSIANTSTNSTGAMNCTYCQKDFKYKRSLANHEAICSKKDEATDQAETKEPNEQSDEEDSSPDENYDNTCDICEKQFSYKAILLHHKRTKHNMCSGTKRASITLNDCAVKCLICDQEMKVKDIYEHNKKHIAMNMKPRNIYTCGVCGNFFKNRAALATHIKYVHRLKKETPKAQKLQSIDPAAFCEVIVAKTEPQDWPQDGSDFGSVPDGVVKLEAPAAGGFVCPTCGKNMPSSMSLKCHMACHKRYGGAAGGRYECFVCKEMFRFQVHYKMHMRIHYNDPNLDAKHLTCPICNRKNKNLRAARAHMAFHQQTRFQVKDYQCSLCKRVFQKRGVYLAHMANHQKRGDTGKNVGSTNDSLHKGLLDGTYTCELCGKACDSELSLKHHTIWHNSKGSLYAARHECAVCKLQFTNKKTLTLHIRTHYENENGPYKCHLCSKGFTEEEYYRRHLKSHNFDHSAHKRRIERLRMNQVKCPICTRYYPDLVKLIRHLKRTHPESKMIKADPDAPPQRYYPCQLCAKVFLDERRLQFHKEAHLRKPVFYKCKFCGKNTMSLKSHNIHIKSHLCTKHIDDPLKCPNCDEKFIKGYDLHYHLRDVHNINETWIAPRTATDLNVPLQDLQCSLCLKILASKGNFQRHIDYHNSLRCNYCFEYFSSLRFLEGHLSFMCEKKKLVGNTEVHPKRVKCHICYKAFHLQVKLDCHLFTQHGIAITKEASASKQEIVCDYCFKIFENEYALSTHKIYHRTIGYYGCKYCAKKFNTLTQYRKHKNAHFSLLNVDNPTKCEHCEERFVAFRDMITHMKDEHGDDSEWFIEPKDSIEETCNICNKTFFNLHKHLSYHEENRCKKCGEYFFSVVDFDNHLCTIESDDEENATCNGVAGAAYEECNFCFKPITTTNSKLKHDKIHRSSGSISCRFCRRKFKTIDAFNIHAFTHRSRKYNKKPIKCRKCGEKFVKYGPFIKHMRSAHKMPLKLHYRAIVMSERCVVCGDEFPNLHNHYRAHLLNQCQQCRKYFTSYKLFNAHECDKEDSDPSKVFTCDEDLTALINSYEPKDEKSGERLYGDSDDEDMAENEESEENVVTQEYQEDSQDSEDVKKFETFQAPVISDVLSLCQTEENSQDADISKPADANVFVISSDEEEESTDVTPRPSRVVVVD